MVIEDKKSAIGHKLAACGDGVDMKFFTLIVQNLARNLMRSLLTAAGTMVLVFVVTLVWSVLDFLAKATTEKSSNMKAIVTEKWRLPSQMPYSYASALKEGAATEPEHIKPLDSMTWTFCFGSLDPKKRTPETNLFAFCLEPRKLLTMMDDLDNLPDDKMRNLAAAVEKMEKNLQGIIVGRDRLKMLKKKVGDRFTLHCVNYKDINLDVEVVGTFPEGRYDLSSAINIEHFLNAMEGYKRTHNNKPHPMTERSLNLVWLRVPDTRAFTQIASQIQESPLFSNPAVKVETSSSGISTFLEAYRDLIWGMRFLLAPAILVTLALVISNAISISVRERQIEFAVLKVLGFRPGQILVLVVGEALLIGVLSGVFSAGGTWILVNELFGGVKFPIAFFPKFLIPTAAWWWGLTVGAGTAFLGSFFPAWSACRIKVSEVFARVG
ncbi:MAG TPA: ABC transporter permease [Planctomycetaceae bacterium]|nr:ABC transporter permease [Planctomycetaceae bacterium]